MNRIEKLKELLQSTPEDCFLLHALGLEYLKLIQVEDAIESFQKVLSIDENYVGTYYHLAKTLSLHHSLDRAIEVYEKGIKIATMKKDLHARNELQMALDDLLDE